MITLRDTFNRRTISRHRTLYAAVRAERSHDRAVRRHNGASSYIPTAILDESGADLRSTEEYFAYQDMLHGC